jgi:uncharacterized surface protein with fasciclin (FAS1) repeats
MKWFTKCFALGVLCWTILPIFAQLPTARLRVAHYVVDGETVDIYVNDVLVSTEPLAFRKAMPYVEVESGDAVVQIVPSGTTGDDAYLTSEIVLMGGHDHTLAFVGIVADETLQGVVLDDTEIVASVRDADVPASYAILLHGISNGPAIVFYFDGEMQIEGLSYGEYGIVTVVAGEHDVLVTFSGDKEAVIFQNTGETAPSNDLLLLTVMTGSYPDNLAVSGAVSRLEGLTALDFLQNYEGTASFKTFLELLSSVDLLTLVDREGTFTVFAPTDEAFAALPSDVLETLQADPELLAQVLQNHIVEVSFNTRYMQTPLELTTLANNILVIEGDEELATINTTVNILFGGFPAIVNGNVIAIDQVLLPSE